jgi:hypothetical protein
MLILSLYKEYREHTTVIFSNKEHRRLKLFPAKFTQNIGEASVKKLSFSPILA